MRAFGLLGCCRSVLFDLVSILYIGTNIISRRNISQFYIGANIIFLYMCTNICLFIILTPSYIGANIKLQKREYITIKIYNRLKGGRETRF